MVLAEVVHSRSCVYWSASQHGALGSTGCAGVSADQPPWDITLARLVHTMSTSRQPSRTMTRRAEVQSPPGPSLAVCSRETAHGAMNTYTCCEVTDLLGQPPPD